MQKLLDFLDSNGITYQRVDHRPVFTCEESALHVPPLPGAKTKNLFLRDGKGKKHYLVSVAADKSADLKALSQALGAGGLSFASADRLERILGLQAGSVTLLGLINDQAKHVEAIIDSDLWSAEAFQVHPLINSSTLSITKDGLSRFLELIEHPPKILSIPSR